MKSIKREEARRRVEQRMAGHRYLGQKAQKVLAYLLLYALMNLIIDRAPGWPFHYTVQYSPNSGGWYLIGIWAYVSLAFGLLFGLCLFSLLVAYIREIAIDRRVEREIDLEMLRLQVQLEQARAGISNPDAIVEKPKRSLTVTDDGEFLQDSEAPDQVSLSARKQ